MVFSDKRIQYAVFIPLVLIITLSQLLPYFKQSDDLSMLDDSRFIAHLDLQIPKLMDEYSIPGVSIQIIKGGEAFWSKAYGYADVEHNRKMTLDAIFRVESISKPVTTWGVMKLAERGLINLDDPVQQYLLSWNLPKSEYNLNKVTIRRLLSNSAGMPQGTMGGEYPPQGERPSLHQYLTKDAHLAFEPASTFQYSNPGFNILELLIEEVTGRDFNEYMKNEVLIPLGMYNSSFDWNEDWSSRVPMGYDSRGNPIPVYVYPYKASGGLFADAVDIARFASAEMATGTYLEHTVLSEKSIQQILTPQVNTSGIFDFVADAYGFGHFTEILPDGKKAYWHGGQGHGWMTHFHIVPKTGDAIVILTNSQRSWPFMASVLNYWSRWQGFGPVKFSRITMAVTGLRIIIGLILLVTLWRAGQIVHGIIVGSRRLTNSLRLTVKTRVAEFSVGVGILGILLWSVTRDYLFIMAIFPIEAIWLAWVLLFLSLVLLTSAFLQVVRKDENSRINH